VDRYAEVKRRAEEARAREAAARQAAIGQWISWCQLTQPLTKRQDPGVDPMRMRCVGGEPAGLLFAILAPSTGHEATVYEQAPPAESFGWGVVFWDGQLRQLDAHDARTGWLVHEHAYTSTDHVIDVEGRDPVRIPSFGYCLRCRRLLALLRSQATEVGVHIEAGRVTDVDAVARSADLVIASDRVNSTLRRQQAGFSTWV
jgi:anthraniloyl-CoA monooxygenase